MSFHWHDNEGGFCPCDEPEQPPTAPELTMLVDYDEKADQWIGHCPEHGELNRLDGSIDAHNLVVIDLARHDEMLHDGDGRVHWSAWLR